MNVKFGQRIRNLRKQKGLTLKEVAAQIDSSSTYVWELENKPARRPAADIVYKLSIAFDVTMEELLSPAYIPTDVDEIFYRKYKNLDGHKKSYLCAIIDIFS